jgi:hypothetical protein
MRFAAAAVMVLVLVFFMAVLGGLVVVLSLAGVAVTLVALPVLWFSGGRRGVIQLLTAWAIYLALYLTISTGLAFAAIQREESNRVHTVGQEVCADAGCFAVDRVEVAGGDYTLYWHLTNSDKQLVRRFPGKGMELYMFDERGRKFLLPNHPDPLDVELTGGATVRGSMTFTVPLDAGQLFLTAEYRPFTFQRLLPGELALMPHRPTKMIRIV